jgi:hypothetical protein
MKVGDLVKYNHPCEITPARVGVIVEYIGNIDISANIWAPKRAKLPLGMVL